MQVIKYPDGTSYAKLDKADHHFTYKINTYDDLIHLAQILEAFNHQKRIPQITIPNLIDAQADRRFDEHQSFGLKVITNILNTYHARYKIFHPHNPEVVEALMDNVEIIDNSEFITTVLDLITIEAEDYEKEQDNPFGDLIILFPDGGAYKWGVKLMDKLNFNYDVIAAAKNRKFIDDKSILTQQLPDYDFEGKNILIIDDILVYGGTFKGLSKLLKERNCGKLYLAVSHMTVQDLGEDPVTNYFDQVFTTNSKYDNYFVRDSEAGGKQPNNLTVIKMF